jgi:small subunit ribosomal protein S8
MITDHIADLLTRIRNAQMAGHPSVILPASKMKVRVLQVFLNEGYISRFENFEEDNRQMIKVYLKYSKHGEPVFKELKRLSKSGQRVYVAKNDIPVYKGGLGTVLISTSEGVLTGREAIEKGVGGELICAVF